jgi:hypothetical protein
MEEDIDKKLYETDFILIRYVEEVVGPNLFNS